MFKHSVIIASAGRNNQPGRCTVLQSLWVLLNGREMLSKTGSLMQILYIWTERLEQARKDEDATV